MAFWKPKDPPPTHPATQPARFPSKNPLITMDGKQDSS